MSLERCTTRSPAAVDEAWAALRVESTGASILSGASSTSVLGGEIINSQRDHNRATFIINLGGSDSDPSRSASAISNPTTSGSVGDSPHASTSSSVRDLPYSSTLSASNEEQSSLEEFSASTDSGLGGSEVSSEVESPDSPPDEEENLVEEEPSNVIYERHMYLKKHGFPLWIPQPNMRLSRSYRRQGVSIGDVGIFTSDGGFDFLFNVCLPTGHPDNPIELPEGFSRLVLRPADISEFHAHSPHGYLASPSVKKREQVADPFHIPGTNEGCSRATFECSGSDGAILGMPQGAYHEDLKNIRRFREYALIHAESWYQYANGPCGREIGNGELHFVTGCDKTTSWGIATHSHLQSKRSEDNMSLLTFNPVGNERQGRHSSYTMYEWDYDGVVEAKSGPQEDELMDLGVNGLLPPRNQCTFIRSLTPAFGKDDWERLELKVESSVKDQATVRSPKSPFPSVFGAISSLSGRIGFLRGHSRGGSSEVTDSMTPAQTTHPATYVIDMMLRKCPKAKVVVVHDSDWCSVIRDSDDDWRYTAQDLPHRIQEAFHIVEEKNGTVYLEEKTRPSHVSVKLDFPVFEERKPGPLHLFDSFEISPSDMQVGSPRSKKIIDNGDGDIKPNKCHDSNKVHLGIDMVDEDSPWSDAFSEYISLPIQKLKSSSAVTFPSLVDGPRRKGRRFAKETTDYLNAWLHRHSEYPYPSEDEKMQLCHATGLSRTQLPGWMVNARRRILGPALWSVSGREVDRTQDSHEPKRPKTKNDQSVEDFTLQPVASEYRKEGWDWVVLYNPNVKKTLDINLVHTFVHASVVSCVHFSADGRYLATGCDRTAQIFNTMTGEKVCVLVHDSVVEQEDLYIRCVRFSPDGKLLATGAEDARIRIWDIAKGRIQQVLDGHQREVYSLDFSRDGRLIISGSCDKTIRIWDLYDKFHKVLSISDYDSQRSDVWSVTVSPDATLVAAGSLDTVVHIWDVASGALLERLQGHKGGIYSVVFTSDGKGLVSGSLDKSVKYWDVSVLAAGSAKSKLKDATPTLSEPSSSSDRSVIPCTMDFVGHKDYVLSVSVIPDSRWVASGSKDCCLHFWDPRNASLQFVLEGHKNSVISVDLSPMGGLVATGSGDYLARIWNYTTV